MGIGARKITISTSGLAPQIRRLADEPEQFQLAKDSRDPDQEACELLKNSWIYSSVVIFFNLTNFITQKI
jgi:adenine C2-methylase RlmN of 23S rRNA A2503 and tRNA A37